MSYLKNSGDLLLETQELGRLQKFIIEDGYEKLFLANTLNFGLVKNTKDSTFNNFKISEGVTGTISITDGLIIGKQTVSGVDKLRFAVKQAQTNIAIPNTSDWFWVKITPQYRPLEKGTISIDAQGNITGVGTEFTKVLRGANMPAKIKLYQNPYQDQIAASLSLNNQFEYGVLEVVNDTTAILTGGTYAAETGLKYSVVGTFTPGYVPPTNDKEIFQYDDCLMQFVAENPATPNVRPAYVQDYEFLIYRVKYDGTNVIIQDKRNDVWKLKSDFNLEFMQSTNVLAGIEQVLYNHPSTPQDKNIVQLAFAFRSSNFSYNTNINKIVVNAGVGGKFKTTTDFTTGDFNNWRVYTSDKANYYKVITSIKVGTTIELSVDKLDIDDFKYPAWSSSTSYAQYDKVSFGLFQYVCTVEGGATIGTDPTTNNGAGFLEWAVYNQEILITPDVEELEVKCVPAYPEWSTGTYTSGSTVSRNGIYYTANSSTTDDPAVTNTTWDLLNTTGLIDSTNFNQLTKVFNFNIATKLINVELPVFNDTCYYNLVFRYKNHKFYSRWLPLSSDNGVGNTRGYYPENFNYNLAPDNTTNPKVKYSGDMLTGYVKLLRAPNAYINFVNKIDTGDRYGIEIRDFDTSIGAINLTVGTDKQEQLFLNTVNTFTFTQDTAINLVKSSSLKDGNKFVIRIKRKIDLNSKKLIITQDFVNFGTGDGNVIFKLSDVETKYLNAVSGNNCVRIECIYDKETNAWYSNVSYEAYKDLLDQVINFETNVANSAGLYTKIFDCSFAVDSAVQIERGTLFFKGTNYTGAVSSVSKELFQIDYYFQYESGSLTSIECNMSNGNVGPQNFVMLATEYTVGVSVTISAYVLSDISTKFFYKVGQKISTKGDVDVASKIKFYSFQSWINTLPSPSDSGAVLKSTIKNYNTRRILDNVILYGDLYTTADVKFGLLKETSTGSTFDLVIGTDKFVADPAEIRVDKDTVVLHYNVASSTTNWSTLLTSGPELKYDLPVDFISRDIVIKAYITAIMDGDSIGGHGESSLVAGVSIGKTTLVDGDAVVMKGITEETINSTISISGAVVLKTQVISSCIHTSDSTIAQSLRIHLYPLNSTSNATIRRVRLEVFGLNK
jgi:hypothetical protein